MLNIRFNLEQLVQSNKSKYNSKNINKPISLCKFER
jgi:hypothetical protein